MRAQIISKDMIPLCFLSDSRLVCYQKGYIIVFDEDSENNHFSISKSLIIRLFDNYRPLTRLLRFGIRTAIANDDYHIVVSRGGRLQEVDLMTGDLSKGWNCKAGVRPLVFSEIKVIDGFEDGVYFGEYYKNDALEPVSIFYRKGIDQWEVVYTFPRGTIKHVHNIIADPYRNCVWIMTGDFGEAAAIWRASDGFKNVERVAGGDQKWRGCVGFAIPEGLLYATDTPFSDNHIFLLKLDGSVETVCDISGSCIYGGQWKEKFVFSSTVEADGRDETMAKLLFSKKRGIGIKDDYVRLYVGDYTLGFKEIYKEKKDCLPFIFQFGAFKFPAGVNNSDTLYFQPVATKKNDLRLMGMTF